MGEKRLMGLLDERGMFVGAIRTDKRAGDRVGAALVDVTTADFWVAETADSARLIEALLLRRPAEVLVPLLVARG